MGVQWNGKWDVVGLIIMMMCGWPLAILTVVFMSFISNYPKLSVVVGVATTVVLFVYLIIKIRTILKR